MSDKPSLTDYFDAVRVINLASRRDRRAQMLSELRRVGLVPDVQNVSFFVAERFTEEAGFPTVGARGCFHSHLAILEEAEREGRGVLILEDDLDFVTDFPSALRAAMAKDRHWHIFYGGHQGRSGSGARARPGEEISASHFVGFSGDAVRRAVPFLQEMLARPPGSPLGGPMHIDGAYGWLRRAYPELITAVAEPCLGYQRPSRTDIHKLPFFDRIVGLRSVAGSARGMKRRLDRYFRSTRAHPSDQESS